MDIDTNHLIIHKTVKEYILSTKEDIGYLKTIKKLDVDFDSLNCSVERFLRGIGMQKQEEWEQAIDYVLDDSKWWD